MNFQKSWTTGPMMVASPPRQARLASRMVLGVIMVAVTSPPIISRRDTAQRNRVYREDYSQTPAN